MTYARTFFRDQITLNNAFKTRLKLESAGPGPVLVAARTVLVDGTFDLGGRDLVVLADRFDGSGGTISLDGQTITPHLTVAARELAGLRAIARGAGGEPGAEGRPGRPGRPGRNASLPFKPGGNGGAGGPGGTGQMGGRGGIGGTISVIYVADAVSGGFDPSALSVPGGPGGDGGPGGPGGPGGEGGIGEPDGSPGPDGPMGATGPVGPEGPPGAVEVSQVSDDGFWVAVLPLAADWAAYRLRMAEYFFRAANPAPGPRSGFLDLALSELTAVTLLAPTNQAAVLLRQRLLAGHNVLGLARDVDIIPDFDHFEQVLVDYGPLVLGIFQSATTLLTGNLTLEQMRATLTREVAHLSGLEVVLQAERAAAERGAKAAEADRVMAGRLFSSNQQRIVQRQQELESRTFGWFDFIGVSAFTALTAVITLATGGGAAAVAAAYLPQILVKLSGDTTGPFASEEAAGVLGAALGLKALLKDGGGEEVGKMVLSYAKLLADVNESDADPELKEMLLKSVELTHSKLVSALRAEQATLALAAADLRLAQARIDRELAQSQLDGLTADTAYLEQVALTLVKSAQGYMDILMRYAFLAARSVEIYTFDDLSAEVFYDYGHVHPDLEQDHRDGFLPLAQLIGAYVTSWSRFVGIITYRTRYDAYLAAGDRVTDKVFLSVTDPAALALFRETRTLELFIDLADLPPTRFEARASYVLLSLAGASAKVPAISALFEHGGLARSRRSDGSEDVLILRPRRTVVQTARTPLAFSGARIGDDPEDLSFWGRGVAAAWRVQIEPDEMERRQVDLSALTAIELEIGFQAFL